MYDEPSFHSPQGPKRLVDKYKPTLQVRPGTTDVKSIEQVWSRNVWRYHREGFTPAPCQTWLDIGSHVGAFGCLAHYLGASVIAIEPDPISAALTLSNFEHCGIQNPVVVEAAVVPNDWKQPRIDLHRMEQNTRRNSICRIKTGSTPLDVKALTIDDACRLYDPDGIKMSIEGAEHQLLQSWDIPQSVHFLAVEWNFGMCPRIYSLAKGFERIACRFRKVKMSKQINFGKETFDQFPDNVYLFGWD
jgi:FkbM family methyltransferase